MTVSNSLGLLMVLKTSDDRANFSLIVDPLNHFHLLMGLQ